MKKTLLLLSLSGFSLLSTAQVTFQRAFGGSNEELGRSIIQTSDGGYAMAGRTQTYGAGSSDLYVVKISGSGVLSWTRTVGGSSFDQGNSIIQTSDDGFAIGGYTNGFGAGSIDAYIVKLSSTGALQWTKTVGGNGLDYCYTITQTSDDGYAIGGYTNSGSTNFDFYLAKLNSSGTPLWARKIGGTGDDYFSSMIKTSDQGFAMVGYTNSSGAGMNDVYVVKTDSEGNIVWTKTIGGSNDDIGTAIVASNDGGYAIGGYTSSYGAGNHDLYIIKLDADGSLLWTRTVGTSDIEEGNSIIQMGDKSYIVAGYKGATPNIYVTKVDSTGTLLSTKSIGGNDDDEGLSLTGTGDGGYALSGFSLSYGSGLSDAYILKFSASGTTCGTSSTGGSSGSGGTSSDGGTSNTADTLSSSGGSSGSGGNNTNICSVITGDENIENTYPDIQISPNPTKGIIFIHSDWLTSSEIIVFNELGEKIFQTLASADLQLIDLSNSPPGMYWVQINSAANIYYNKFIIAK